MVQYEECQQLVPVPDAGPKHLGGIGVTTVYKLVAKAS